MPIREDLFVSIEAQVQDKVADFLRLKGVLVGLRSSPNFTVRQKAGDLYRQQLALEETLRDVLKTVDNIKAGAYTFSDLRQVFSFGAAIDAHRRAVNTLRDEDARTVRPNVEAAKDFGKSVLVLGAIAGAGLWLAMRQPRRR